MPGFGDLLNTLQLNGLRVDAAKQAVQAQGIDLQQKQEMYRLQKQYREAALQGLELNPNLANPDTKSISESEASRMSPEDRMVRDFQTQLTDAQRNLQLARAFNPKEEQHWITRVDNLTTNFREAQKYAIDRREKKAKEIANMWRDVDSAEAAKQALISTYEIDPQMAQDVYKKLPTEDNGEIRWNETAKRAIAPMVSAQTSMAESEQQKRNALSLQQRKENAKAREDHWHEQERQARENAARKQAGGNAAQPSEVDMQKWYGDLNEAGKTAADLDAWNYINKNYLPYRKGTGGGNDANNRIKWNAGRILDQLGITGAQAAGASAEYKADAFSMYFQTKKLDAIQGQMDSLHKNINTWNDVASGKIPELGAKEFEALGNKLKKINFTGVQSINDVKLRVQQEFGDPATAAYMVAASAVAIDVARIRQGTQSVASLTEGNIIRAMQDVSRGLPPDARQGVIASLVSDSEGQVAGIQNQLGRIRRRMGLPERPIMERTASPETALIRKAVEAAGQKYEPDVYDYEIRNGKVVKAKKE